MLVNDLTAFLTQWSHWLFLVQAIAVALTALVPPLPAEFMVIASGAMAADGAVALHWVFLATFPACLIGDLGLYALFRYTLIRVLLRWRWGRRLHRKIVYIAARTGKTSTWLGLLLVYAMPFGRSAAMATAGMVPMGWGRLLGLAVTGGLLWSWWLIGLGYVTTIATDLPLGLSTVAGITLGTAAGAAIAVISTRRRQTRLPQKIAG